MPLDRLQFHPIRPSLLARKQRLPLPQVGIHHEDGSGIIIQLAHSHRHLVKSGELCGLHAVMPGDNLISPVQRPHQHGHEHAVLADAVGQVPQSFIRIGMKGMVGKGMQLGDVQRIHLGKLGAFGDSRFKQLI